MKRNKLKSSFDLQAISKYYTYRKKGIYGRYYAIKNKAVHRYSFNEFYFMGRKYLGSYEPRSKRTEMQLCREYCYKGLENSKTNCWIRSLFLNGEL